MGSGNIGGGGGGGEFLFKCHFKDVMDPVGNVAGRASHFLKAQ